MTPHPVILTIPLAAIASINATMHADDPERLAAIDRVIHGRVAA